MHTLLVVFFVFGCGIFLAFYYKFLPEHEDRFEGSLIFGFVGAVICLFAIGLPIVNLMGNSMEKVWVLEEETSLSPFGYKQIYAYSVNPKKVFFLERKVENEDVVYFPETIVRGDEISWVVYSGISPDPGNRNRPFCLKWKMKFKNQELDHWFSIVSMTIYEIYVY